ncbi:MAG: N-acyl-D-amino-acid deacylase [Gaiellales bacterium]|jgi:N-acyl-D-amino-acid deacylase|nr:N-acyl-D-amino-acid deacylase [Gaiellales bacterium]
MHDLVIRGGTVVDGRGGAAFTADVAVVGDTITAIGNGLGAARATIDARGLHVCPGFVDVHTHSDFTLPVRPAAEAKLLQGITTDCTGNCGFSPFPLAPGVPGGERHGVFIEPLLDQRWATFDAYADAMTERRPGINLAQLVGLGAVRLAAVGEEERPATERELQRMRDLVTEALKQGAFGASSGLVYAPSGFADLAELVAVTGPVADHGRLYATHMRDEGDRLEESVEEALATASGSGCRLQISHHKAFGEANWGKVELTLRRIEQAAEEGLDVAVDVYPYTAGCTTLAAALPPTALAGGEAAVRRRLADPEARRALVALLDGGEKSLDTIILGATPSRPDIGGRRLVELARADGVSPADLLFDIISADGLEPIMLVDGMSEQDVRTVIAHETSVFGSDGWTMATDAAPYTHPRDYAAAVRLLAHYVRDQPLLGLEAAIGKLTAKPAARLGLGDRGVLASGMAADVTVIDLQGLEEVATFEHPCHHPRGVRHVLVNGVVAVEDGVPTGGRGGRVLRASDNR